MVRILQRMASAMLASLVLWAPGQALAGVDVFGEITFATDYLFRGVSQTMSDAALHGELGFEHENGLYGYAWASNVKFVDRSEPDDGARTELNFGAGYSMALTDRLGTAIGVTRYLYPSTKTGFDYDYDEWHGTLVLDDAYTLAIGYSDNVFNTGTEGIFYSLGTDWELSDYFSLYVELGHYDLQRAYGESYNFGELAITGATESLSWRLSYFSTTDEAAEIFNESTVGDRVVFALSLSF